MIKRLLACILVLGIFAGSPSKAAAQAAESNRPAWAGLEVKFGLDTSFRPESSKYYYSVTHRGKLLTENGTASKASDSLGLFELPSQEGDTQGLVPRFKLDIFKGTGNLDGDLFEALNLQNLVFAPIDLGPLFMAQSQLNGSFDGKYLNAGIGVEGMPISLQRLGLFKGQRGLASWVVPGALAVGDWSEGVADENRGSGQLTYRAFIGKAFKWEASKIHQAPFQLDEFLSEFPDKEKLKVEAQRALGLPKKSLREQFAIAQWASEDPPLSEDPRVYKDQITDAYNLFMRGYLIEPSYAVWLESKGWYTFTGSSQGERFKPLVAVVLTLWGDYGSSARSQVQLRYENGFDRAAPTVRQNRLLLTLGLNF